LTNGEKGSTAKRRKGESIEKEKKVDNDDL